MLFRFLILVNAIFALSLTSTGYADDVAGSPDFAVDLVTTGFQHMRFPYFNKGIEPLLTKEVADKCTETTIELLTTIDRLIAESLEPNSKGFGTMRMFKIGKEMKGIVNKYPQEAVKLSEKFGFDKYILNLVDRMVDTSQYYRKEFKKSTEKPPSEAWLAKELHRSITGVVEAIRASKVSVFISLGEGFVDDQTSLDHVTKLMGLKSYYREGNLLNIVRAALRTLLMYNQIKNSITKWG